MEYEGKLYGKIGNKHFDTGKTSYDWDYLEKSLEFYKKKLQVAKKALSDILIWQEDVDDKWEYPETIASNALKKLAKIDDF